MLQAYEWFLWGMAALAVVVFIALYHVKAGYGLLRDGRWGPKIGNRLGWFLMESPVFIAMCLFWFCSLLSPQFIAGASLFFLGMGINIHSDRIIRHLRQPGDTGHYLPRGGMFRYVSSANYFGEIIEWTGFAVLTWSAAGAVFALWTFANLVPRADAIYHRYGEMFGDEFRRARLKRVIPFIY